MSLKCEPALEQSNRSLAELDEKGKALRKEILLLSAQCEAVPSRVFTLISDNVLIKWF